MKTYLSILLPFLLLAACATVPITGRRQLSIVPASELNAAALTSYQQLIAESKLSTDPAVTSMNLRVGQRIAAAAESFLRDAGAEDQIRNYAWEFKVIDAPDTVNAFCMPGGKVAVYTGILPVTKDEAGLAVVVGHEVAHALANHGGERMSQSLLVQLGGLTLSQALGNKSAETRGLLLAAYGVGSSVGVVLPFSRKQEYEADHIGLILMARAGYNPNAAIGFWQRMSQSGGAKPPEFLSTHPSDESRIANMQAEIPEAMKYYVAR